MSNQYSLYDTASGAFTGTQIFGDPAILKINPPPPGHAWMPGFHNPQTCRVALITDDQGQQVPGIAVQAPVLPAETEWVSWAWDAAADAPRPVPKLPLRKEGAKQPLMEHLAELDKLVARPAGEITEAMALGDAPPAAAVTRLRSINADKTLIRARMHDISACASVEQLNSLLADPLILQNRENP